MDFVLSLVKFGIDFDMVCVLLQTIIAKKWHFAYSTPRKIRAFRTKIDFSESNEDLDEIEAPNAPRQQRLHRALPSRKNLEEISVNLLDSLEEGIRRGLFMDEDDE